MYNLLRHRSRHCISEFILLLDDMSLVELRDPNALMDVMSVMSSTDTDIETDTSTTPSMLPRSRPLSPTKEGGNVKVVVRVRKFLQRGRLSPPDWRQYLTILEIDRNAKCLVEMNSTTQETQLHPPKRSASDNSARKSQEERSFTFDKSFWSHDVTSPHYSHQADIYNSFGEEFLDHNFEGYHTCIFAYGQTGSGKSYTMMGTKGEPGLIPRTCEALFHRIKAETSASITYNVHVSYFEVYNENVRDLLAPRSTPPAYLKIRESKTEGVYVQGLTDSQVRTYQDVERLMKTGDLNRTTASTKMNDTSSRSHAVFTLTLKQIQHDIATDSTIERLARMRLVDLAGSERAAKTEATGQRLREGGNINQSLTTLGRVIAALADPKRQRILAREHAQGRGSSPVKRNKALDVVPYRDSVLTWLLKDSLGGNSKTAMVACIGPTDYDETLSTLRYADQAKRIRTRAHVNEDAVSAAERDAKIVEMQETIRELQLCMNSAQVRKRDEVDKVGQELEEYQSQVLKMQRAMQEAKAISDVKIRALTLELEELRPMSQTLKTEVESLRRHLALALGELKHPIILPDVLSDDDMSDDGSCDGSASPSSENWDADVHDLMQDLGLFRRKVADDHARFVKGASTYCPSVSDHSI